MGSLAISIRIEFTNFELNLIVLKICSGYALDFDSGVLHSNTVLMLLIIYTGTLGQVNGL